MGLKLKWNSPVILTFALVCTAVFVADMLMMGKLMPVFTVYPSVDWSNPFSLASLVTHVFGHANLEHLLGNLTFILLLGPIIEEKYGSKRLIYMILATALITGFINIIFFNTGLDGSQRHSFYADLIGFVYQCLFRRDSGYIYTGSIAFYWKGITPKRRNQSDSRICAHHRWYMWKFFRISRERDVDSIKNYWLLPASSL
jgi:membrane associated rhomboid family serine protease